MKREHSMGVSVSDTMTDTRMVSVTVTANSRNRRPTIPPISNKGMKTATRDTEIETMVKLISLAPLRSEEHTSELQSLMRISYAVFCLKKKKNKTSPNTKIS